MKKSECVKGMAVQLANFAKEGNYNKLGIGVIDSEPFQANGTNFNVMVLYPNNQRKSHPIARLAQVTQVS